MVIQISIFAPYLDIVVEIDTMRKEIKNQTEAEHSMGVVYLKILDIFKIEVISYTVAIDST